MRLKHKFANSGYSTWYQPKFFFVFVHVFCFSRQFILRTFLHRVLSENWHCNSIPSHGIIFGTFMQRWGWPKFPVLVLSCWQKGSDHLRCVLRPYQWVYPAEDLNNPCACTYTLRATAAQNPYVPIHPYWSGKIKATSKETGRQYCRYGWLQIRHNYSWFFNLSKHFRQHLSFPHKVVIKCVENETETVLHKSSIQVLKRTLDLV